MSEESKRRPSDTEPTLRIFGDVLGFLKCTLCRKEIPWGKRGVDQRFAIVTNDVCICDETIADLAVQYLEFVEERMLQGAAPAVAELFLEKLFHGTFLAKYFAAVGNCPVGFVDFRTIESRVDPLKVDVVRQLTGDRAFCEEHRIVPVNITGGMCVWAFRAVDSQDLPSLAMWQASLLPALRVGLPTFVRVKHLDFQALLNRYFPAPAGDKFNAEAETLRERLAPPVEPVATSADEAAEERANESRVPDAERDLHDPGVWYGSGDLDTGSDRGIGYGH